MENEIPALRKCVLTKIERVLGEKIAPFIKAEEILSPPLIEEKTQSYLGALYGASVTIKWRLFYAILIFRVNLKTFTFVEVVFTLAEVSLYVYYLLK